MSAENKPGSELTVKGLLEFLGTIALVNLTAFGIVEVNSFEHVVDHDQKLVVQNSVLVIDTLVGLWALRKLWHSNRK